jgi:hypothetical protein
VEQRIHLTDVPPAFCAGCYQAKPDSRHVDLGAAYDGPAFAQEDKDVVGGKVVTVDDLILCEDCVTIAAARLGLGDVAEKTAECERFAETVERLSDRLAAQNEHIANLERAEQSREQLETTMEPPRRQARKPRSKVAG